MGRGRVTLADGGREAACLLNALRLPFLCQPSPPLDCPLSQQLHLCPARSVPGRGQARRFPLL
jgi:hypothetical protein